MRNTEYFHNKSFCELVITSQELSPEDISSLLLIAPTRHYTKGENISSPVSGTKGKRFQHLWALKSEPIVSDKEDISNHLAFFQSKLQNLIEKIRDNKRSGKFQVIFYVWIDAESTSTGVSLTGHEMLFLGSISDYIQFVVVGGKSF